MDQKNGNGRPGRSKEKPLTREDMIKGEIAQELGLDIKVKELGWGALTSAESGRIGGLLAARKKGMRT